ncbi:TetR/AcrR family transcriptional regulator [Neptuniibacter sp.]|jgi:AcrR family transcriptional regulator|uniref:TetR/AcrR family transcriptional regulator n=1 Tax=Neptuniibacter sp. TaxID=1962643 RepID=UPI003B5C5E8E
MANTAKHDRLDVIQKATWLFWEKGFHATSMRDLQDKIDMRPGSIYAAFGSKEGLFKEALKFYAEQNYRLLKNFQAEASPLNALKQFVICIGLSEAEETPNEMCMLVKSISELTEENLELLEQAKALLQSMESIFTEMLIQAQEQGEMDKSKDPQRLARLLQMQLIGLRAYQRANPNKAQMSEMIEDMFKAF